MTSCNAVSLNFPRRKHISKGKQVGNIIVIRLTIIMS